MCPVELEIRGHGVSSCILVDVSVISKFSKEPFHRNILAKHLSQSIKVYSWVNVHFLFADSYISAYGLTADVLPESQTRELKFMGYVLVTETLKLVYLRVPFHIFFKSLQFLRFATFRKIAVPFHWVLALLH